MLLVRLRDEGPIRPGNAQQQQIRLHACHGGAEVTNREINSYEEFWPYYVSEHSHPATRTLHLIGTLAAIGCLFILVAAGRWYLFPLALIPGYSCAWIGHFFIEHNKPATFKYPLWSFLSDYKMIVLMLTGQMNREVSRYTHHVSSKPFQVVRK